MADKYSEIIEAKRQAKTKKAFEAWEAKRQEQNKPTGYGYFLTEEKKTLDKIEKAAKEQRRYYDNREREILRKRPKGKELPEINKEYLKKLDKAKREALNPSKKKGKSKAGKATKKPTAPKFWTVGTVDSGLMYWDLIAAVRAFIDIIVKFHKEQGEDVFNKIKLVCDCDFATFTAVGEMACKLELQQIRKTATKVGSDNLTRLQYSLDYERKIPVIFIEND